MLSMTCSDQTSDHLQKIWSNWRERTGPCTNCPHWGNGGGKAPHYGVGEVSGDDPTIAFVGHEGGTGGKTELTDIVNRDMPRLSEEQLERVRNFIQESYPLEFEDYRATDMMQSGMCNGNLTESGNPNSPYLRECYDAFRDSNARSHSLYFTNIKKCGESYSFDEKESGSKEATSHCIEYLSPELEYLDPDIIVPFGNRAAGAVFTNYEFKQGRPSGFDKEHPYKAGGIRSESLKLHETQGGIGVIPSIHFSDGYFQQNFPQMLAEREEFPENMSRSDYWQKMVSVADEFITASN